jgi:hypothetical protein
VGTRSPGFSGERQDGFDDAEGGSRLALKAPGEGGELAQAAPG